MNQWSGLSGVHHALFLGAHCDDIEIGCGGLLMGLPDLAMISVVVFSGSPIREAETREALGKLAGPRKIDVRVLEFRDGFFPMHWADIKVRLEAVKTELTMVPDLILTHYHQDKHQDHRIISELTWNTFRDHTVLEYEILKYDDDLGSPNAYLPLSEHDAQRKASTIVDAFASQADKKWMTQDSFLALMRVRGVQCQSQFAEAFYARKVRL